MAGLKGPTHDAHSGREKEGFRLVNPPTAGGSTVLFPDCESFVRGGADWFYGRMGTPTHRALEESLLPLEAATDVTLTSSGLAAISLALLAVVKPGAHILVTDSAYDPTRGICDGLLQQMGVETTYYPPTVGAGIKDLIRQETAAILCESPGSLTFEVQDLPAITEAAGAIPIIVDNTWAAGALFKPLDHGAAISIQALTKYVGGHSDFLMGAVFTRDERMARRIQKTARHLGTSVSAGDVTLAHRGLRTLHRRLAVHAENGLEVARWLEAHPAVARVLHPALPSHPQHDLFQRDFAGTCSLFGAVMAWDDQETTARFVDTLSLFGLGYSWGGFESLCMPAFPARYRTAEPWKETRQLLRFHIGLEDPSDLIENIEKALKTATGDTRHG